MPGYARKAKFLSRKHGIEDWRSKHTGWPISCKVIFVRTIRSKLCDYLTHLSKSSLLANDWLRWFLYRVQRLSTCVLIWGKLLIVHSFWDDVLLFGKLVLNKLFVKRCGKISESQLFFIDSRCSCRRFYWSWRSYALQIINISVFSLLLFFNRFRLRL